MYDAGVTPDNVPASITVAGELGSALTQLLTSPEIVPGSDPSYELCKNIYSYHPLGAVLAEAPIKRAQGKPRVISIPVLAENRIVEQFVKTWDEIGGVGGTVILRNLFKLSRVYGIASLGVGERGKDTKQPLDLTKIASEDLYFNVLDPLNTAGSLVLNQDPNSPDYLKPDDRIHVNGKLWHPSRLSVKMHEEPIYIQWSSSAFGFVGRSVYQRALYSLKTYLQSMITNQMIMQKSGLLVAKMETPGSIVDNLTMKFFGAKRAKLKEGATGQVLSIGLNEEIATLNMQNLDGPFEIARRNVLKDIASASGMPASIIAQETLTEGFGEGTEDAKKEAAFIEDIQTEMEPGYSFMDRIVMRKAWTKEFYETLKPYYAEYRKKSYETALHEWMQAFQATWPNPLAETDSEKAKQEEVQCQTVIAVLETLLPNLDPVNKGKVLTWACENLNGREMLFSGAIDIDEDELVSWLEENREAAKMAQEQQGAAAETPARRPRPFSAAS